MGWRDVSISKASGHAYTLMREPGGSTLDHTYPSAMALVAVTGIDRWWDEREGLKTNKV